MAIKYWMIKIWGQKPILISGDNITGPEAARLTGVDKLGITYGGTEITKEEYDNYLRVISK
jgi:hypothetical protein